MLLDGLARVGVLDLVDDRLIPVAAPLSIRRIDLYEEANDHTLSSGPDRIGLYATPPGSAWPPSGPRTGSSRPGPTAGWSCR
ncbi:hypothetical protein [Streptomyces sp. CA-179760]|uniref:hypothetical protein n=1 Tax=Streptomyces sp. CA-179760 TaxID=3240054 RepID=UPI003D91348B